MKTKLLHIFLGLFLLATVLFSQVALVFLHHHESSHATEKTKGSLVANKDSKDCQVCSLHLDREWCTYGDTFHASIDTRFFDFHLLKAPDFNNPQFLPSHSRAPPAL